MAHSLVSVDPIDSLLVLLQSGAATTKAVRYHPAIVKRKEYMPSMLTHVHTAVGHVKKVSMHRHILIHNTATHKIEFWVEIPRDTWRLLPDVPGTEVAVLNKDGEMWDMSFGGWKLLDAIDDKKSAVECFRILKQYREMALQEYHDDITEPVLKWVLDAFPRPWSASSLAGVLGKADSVVRSIVMANLQIYK